jgi:hypothetical protein
MSARSRFARFAFVLTFAALPLSAQDVERRLADMEKRLGDLQGEVERRAAREKELEGKVGVLETKLAERDATEASRMKELEDRLVGRTSEIDKAIDRLEALETSPAAASRLRVGGYFDFEFRADEATEKNTFDQHRFVLKFDGDVTDFVSFRSEVEFEGGGAGASYLSNNYVAIEYAEVRFRFDRAFNVKAGALLMPFGRYNYAHDSPLQDLTDRPYVATFIVPTTWTEAGVGAFGGVQMGDVLFDYDVVVTNGLDQGFSTTPGGGMRDSRSSFRADNNDQKQIAGRVGVTPDVGFLDGLSFGASGLWGTYDDLGTQDVSMFGFDLFVKKGPFELLGEAVWANLDRTPTLATAGVPGGLDGWYLEGRFHFFPESWRGATSFFGDESTFTLVFRAEAVDTDDSATAIDFAARGDAFRDDARRYTIGLNFRPSERTVIKFEYQFIDEPGALSAGNDRIVMSIATSF